MAASRNSNREFGDRRNPLNYYERNRTFSSTTNDHFRNKLSQIGIEKDLRELLERKRHQKNHDKNLPNTCSNGNTQKAERKVRFEGEPILRRSKSFSSDSTKNQENFQRYKTSCNRFLMENNLDEPQHIHKNRRMRNPDFVDLQHPTNIKIELQTDTGARKYTVDSSVPIPDIKCNLKKSRTLSKHSEPKDKSAVQLDDNHEMKNERMRVSTNFRGTTLQTDSGARKYTVDSSVPIPDIKCNLKKSRTLLKHSEPEDKSAVQLDDYHEKKNERMRVSTNFRGTTRRSFNKNKEHKKQNSTQNKEADNDSAVLSVVENFSNLEIKNESKK